MKKCYQKLSKLHNFGKKEEDETKKIENEEGKTKKRHPKSYLYYGSKFTFYKYHDIKKNLLVILLLQNKKT